MSAAVPTIQGSRFQRRAADQMADACPDEPAWVRPRSRARRCCIRANAAAASSAGSAAVALSGFSPAAGSVATPGEGDGARSTGRAAGGGEAAPGGGDAVPGGRGTRRTNAPSKRSGAGLSPGCD